MAMPRALPAILGALAILTTTAILAIHIVLAQSLLLDGTSSVRSAAIVSSVLEAGVLVFLVWFTSSHIGRHSIKHSRGIFHNLWFGLSLALCTVTAASSVSTIVCLSNALPTTIPSTILGSTATGFLVGCSVALGLSSALQLIFLVVHYILGRIDGHSEALSLHTEEERRSPQPPIKSIPYHLTSPAVSKNHGSASMDSRSPPGSSGGRSATETISSIRSSLSHVVRPISSKTRLLSGGQRSRRPASLDSTAFRDRVSLDGFASWDTSAVDPQNRQTVLESSSPTPGRFLETIPASPSTSRSPSPGTPLDLEPLKTRRRSRSYSPASTRSRRAQRATFTQQANASESNIDASESHIHPLFRSDSPTPPPLATPGTVVTAAPNGGQIISDRQSIRTLTRMRSGSLPAVSSPLTRQSSFDDLPQRREKGGSNSPEQVLREEPEELGSETERKMTPPIPDWILSAGSRTSLWDYNSRKTRSADNSEAEGQTEG